MKKIIFTILGVAILLGFSFYNKNFTDVVLTEEEIYEVIREQMLERSPEIKIKTTKDIMQSLGNLDGIFERVGEIDNSETSQDGDYLASACYGLECSWKYSIVGTSVMMTLEPKYLSTNKEENILTKRINAVIAELDLDEKSDYDKVKEIHDYIINRVTYDESLTKPSAYSAMVDKSTTCQGYSTLAYRMLTDVGIDTRIIKGHANSTPHMWNIVKVDNEWYNIDLTWDDPVSLSGEEVLRYDFFLKSERDFTGHIRNPEYEMETFTNKYPISETSYGHK